MGLAARDSSRIKIFETTVDQAGKKKRKFAFPPV
jgi:hypothetical protein